MSFDDIHPDRVQALNDKDLNEEGRYILYWMQQSQRGEWNHALEYAIRMAKEQDCTVLSVFGLTEDYPDGNARHFHFMVQGLQDAQESLAKRDVKLLIRMGNPPDVALELKDEAVAIVCDRGYLRHQREWREQVAEQVDCQVIQVESDLVVPIESASDKQEYAARTIRKQLMEQYEDYLEKLSRLMPPKSSTGYSMATEDISSADSFVENLNTDHSVAPVEEFTGGTKAAKRLFSTFMNNHLTEYDEHRSDPHLQHVSYMSMYLHLGQISPCYLLSEVKQSHSYDNRDSYIDELLVRRELAANFVFYTPDHYDDWQGLPDWARETLEDHKDDDREKVYTRSELENAETDDEYWNAAMTQMKQRGYLHNHMRMYWGKRILAYTNTPRYAYKTALYLNNKYFLDGRDCNSFANIAWLFGRHDRAWQERDVYGKVRIMTPGGLEGKTDIDKFVEMVEADS